MDNQKNLQNMGDNDLRKYFDHNLPMTNFGSTYGTVDEILRNAPSPVVNSLPRDQNNNMGLKTNPPSKLVSEKEIIGYSKDNSGGNFDKNRTGNFANFASRPPSTGKKRGGTLADGELLVNVNGQQEWLVSHFKQYIQQCCKTAEIISTLEPDFYFISTLQPIFNFISTLEPVLYFISNCNTDAQTLSLDSINVMSSVLHGDKSNSETWLRAFLEMIKFRSRYAFKIDDFLKEMDVVHSEKIDACGNQLGDVGVMKNVNGVHQWSPPVGECVGSYQNTG